MITANKLNLRWDSHASSTFQGFWSNYQRGSMVDTTLTCEGKTLKAHRLVLGACSPVLQEFFDHCKMPDPVVNLGHYKYEDIRSVVEFMYRGEVKVKVVDLQRFLATAESLQVKGLSCFRVGIARPGQNIGSVSTPAPVFSPATTTPESSGPTSGHGHASHTINGLADGTASVTVQYVNTVKGGRSGQLASSTSPVAEPKLQLAPIPMDSLLQQPDNENDLGPSVEDNDLGPRDTHIVQQQARVKPKEKCPLPSVSQLMEEVVFNGGGPEVLSVRGPLCAFSIFAAEWRPELKSMFPKDSNTEIKQTIRIMWKQLPGPEKADYIAAAKEAKDAHNKFYPNYRSPQVTAQKRKLWRVHQKVQNMIAAGQ